ncbi:MAG TPA: glycosyltransferase family 1 protein [Planctomycetota bacterium]|nr:glycosyltransferase family 1 protein [Planctomycetota bacterium]
MPPDHLRVLLVGNYASDRQQSMLRFGEMMKRGLLERTIDVTLLQPDARWLGQHNPGAGLGKWLGHGDKLVRFPAILRAAARDHDVVHILDHSNAPYCRTISDRPHLVTCHDLLAIRSAMGEFPENPTRWSGRRLQAMILRGIKQARMVACVSRATQTDLARVAGINGDRSRVVPNGLNHPYCPMPAPDVAARLSAHGMPASARYLLHVGGNHWYKHRSAALRIVAALRRIAGHGDIHLVMVGEPLDHALRTLATTEGLTGHLHEFPGISNDDLNALYNGALGLVFPSLYEGFGWPVIEAQAAGCPVFIAEREPLPEIAGAFAIRFDLFKLVQAAAAIAEALPRRAELVVGGSENAARYSAAAMIDGYLSLYRTLIP